ncbi:NAD(P)-binding protein [Mollisia scopiformis]|uniref:NAD(P)-binding protein n=1 Tax=Mollisia scopiformis TaxID=149040 RepID=A0A132BAV0_MOLSC|nr:NAD(P)-binding protein [Mollisia scopiformis]KUJ08974.1 NAD(P)-binding protein [Mollisia scopiformis]
MKGASFSPVKDIPSLAGKVFLITGGNVGIGKQCALDLAKHNPAQIWIAARNSQTGQAAVTEIKTSSPGVSVQFLEMDLSSFGSVKNGAKKFISIASRLDVLILNAGIMGGPAATTKEGYEIRFGTNHMGHALLFKLLTPILEKTASTPGSDVRILSLTSTGYSHSHSTGIEFETLKSEQEHINIITKYCQSKLANLLYAQEMAKRYPQFTAVSLHPGEVKTELFTPDAGLLMRVIKTIYMPLVGVSVEEGAENSLWAATAKGVVTGEYYFPIGKAGTGTGFAKDDKLAKKLWEWTEKELKGQDI